MPTVRGTVLRDSDYEHFRHHLPTCHCKVTDLYSNPLLKWHSLTFIAEGAVDQASFLFNLHRWRTCQDSQDSVGRIDAVGLPQAAPSGLIRPGKNRIETPLTWGKGRSKVLNLPLSALLPLKTDANERLKMVKRDRRNQDNPVVFFDITIGGRDVGKIVFELYKDVVPKVCTLAYVLRSKKPMS